MTTQAPVIIIGAGMAGLSCAIHLQKAGIDALILEASDDVGGRVCTDIVDDFRLDRGFQILLTAYPEAQRLFNYQALDLQTFRSGALIQHENQWMKLLNPLREPSQVFQTLFSPVGTIGDKLRIIELLWFGDEVKEWRHLRSYTIPHALPAYGPESVLQPIKLSEHLYQCGDQMAYPSLNAALLTGRLVAESIKS